MEASYETQLNAHHFFHAVEGHEGDVWFHFTALNTLYGSGLLVPILLLVGLFYLIRNAVNKLYAIAISSAIIITYTFFTIASTKMTSFTIIVSPFLFLGLAVLLDRLCKWVDSRMKSQNLAVIFRSLLLVFVCFFILKLSKLQNFHTHWKPHDNHNRTIELAQIELIKSISAILGDEKFVVFNPDVRLTGHIELMFYTDYIAYDFFPINNKWNTSKSNPIKLLL